MPHVRFARAGILIVIPREASSRPTTRVTREPERKVLVVNFDAKASPIFGQSRERLTLILWLLVFDIFIHYGRLVT